MPDHTAYRYLPDRWPLFWFELRRAWRRERWLMAGLSVLSPIFSVIITLGHRDEDANIWAIVLSALLLLFTLSTAGSTLRGISHEAQHGTLDALFLTPLPTDEIIHAKLWANLTPRLLLVVISGGLMLTLAHSEALTPWLVSLSHLAMGAVVVGGGCIGLAASARARRVWEAQLRAYVPLLCLLVLNLLMLPPFTFTVLAPSSDPGEVILAQVMMQFLFGCEMAIIAVYGVFYSLVRLGDRRHGR